MFQPTLPFSGYAGWTFLERTMERQSELLSETPANERLTTHFREKIGQVLTPEQLVEDRQLLEVALGAFGLSEDINNKAFIRKVLSDGTQSADSLANKLADDRYAAFSEAFGFDGAAPKTIFSGFADSILQSYSVRSFEVAVGEQQDDLRLALNAKRELEGISAGTDSEDAKWFRVMGNTALRTVFETALNLPSSFSQLDLDKQLDVFKDKARARFGSQDVAQFQDPKAMEGLIQQFLLQTEIQSINQTTSSASIALSLIGG